MKFGTKLGNEQLYCVLKNQPHIAYQSLYLSNFPSLLVTEFSITDFSASVLDRVFKFVYMMRTTKCITENKTKVLRFIFAFFFVFFPFSISHSKVMSIEISVKYFAGTTWPRILKFGTKLGNEQLYCVLKNPPHIAYQSLYLSNFPSLLVTEFSITDFSASVLDRVFKFVYMMRTTKCITENKTKVLRFIFAFFFYFPISHAYVMNIEFFVKDFSGTT